MGRNRAWWDGKSVCFCLHMYELLVCGVNIGVLMTTARSVSLVLR